MFTEVRYARWVVDEEDNSIIHCSNCGMEMYRPVDRSGSDVPLNYCNCCGRRMITLNKLGQYTSTYMYS